MDVDFDDIGGGGGGGNSGETPDITSDLLQKFSCMNTNDHDVLVQQFKVVLGEKCLETNPEFWLDMNNWNLQAAVCAYFDYESQNSNFLMKLPSLKFVSCSSMNSNFNEEMPPNHSFVYNCLLENCGDQPWPLGCSVRFAGGTQMAKEERILLPCLMPGQRAELKLLMVTPEATGFYQSQWRPATIIGQSFGETLFIIINVTNDMTENVAQLMSSAHLIESSTCAAIPGTPWTTNLEMSDDVMSGPSLDQPQPQLPSPLPLAIPSNYHLSIIRPNLAPGEQPSLPITTLASQPQSTNTNNNQSNDLIPTNDSDPNIDDSMS